jgi:uncharacterized protein (TIGR02145 family)
MVIGLLAILTSSCEKDDFTVTDIDGNGYHDVSIGTQVWLKENLITSRLNDGTAIPVVTDDASWENLSTPGNCYYGNNEKSVKATYGTLYNWYAVNTGKLCPTGWHVPTDAEWKTLISYLGGESLAGGKLKETGTDHWISPNTGATNETGFTARAGGERDMSAIFNGSGAYCFLWASTEYDVSSAWTFWLSCDNNYMLRGTHDKNEGFSVRCLKD